MDPVVKGSYFLTIDPGLTNVGYALFYGKNLIYASCLQTEVPKLKHIFIQLEDIIRSHPISYCILENTFVRNGARSSLSLAAAQGVIILLCELYNLPMYRLNSNTVRKKVLGNGRADKKTVQIFILQYLKENYIFLEKKINHNIADAILLGLYYI